MTTVAVNFFINAAMVGWDVQDAARKKYNCNIPWTILVDPTSACNLHCTGCWAAEYGNKLNLSFDEIDSIICQGKELGILSTQYCEDADIETIRNDVKQHIIIPTIPKELLDKNTQIFINPTGRFVVGGPAGDSGLTGRKLIVDTYGGYARHGGGSFSGKDSTKVDRSGTYMARYIAKNIGAAAFLPIVAGIYIVMGSIFDIQISVEMRRIGIGNWALSLVLGIIGAIFAFFLILNRENPRNALKTISNFYDCFVRRIFTNGDIRFELDYIYGILSNSDGENPLFNQIRREYSNRRY